MSKHLIVPKELDPDELSRLEKLARQGSERERDYSTDTLDIYACCIPASGKVPGDYVGVVRSGNDARIVLADGMGKGLRAFYHAQLVTTEFFVGAHTRGDELTLEEISRRFAEASIQSIFFSAFILLDVKEREDAHHVNIYGMGQPPPLMYRACSRQIEEVPALSGVAVGIPVPSNGKKPYAVFSTYLGVGDTLLAFSDGVTEARNRRGTMFAEAKHGLRKSFLKSVKKREYPDEIAQDILYDIAWHCGKDEVEGTWQDDITLAVVRVKHHENGF